MLLTIVEPDYFHIKNWDKKIKHDGMSSYFASQLCKRKGTSTRIKKPLALSSKN